MITREWAFTAGTGHHRCPSCDKPEIACSVWDESGYRHVKCHRASCGAYAKYPLGPRTEAYTPTWATTLNPYRGDSYAPRGHALWRLETLFGFVPSGTRTVGYTTPLEDTVYLHPILGPHGGEERGIVEAVYGPHKRRRIWKAREEPMISWTPIGAVPDTVVIVEDIVSAWKLWYAAEIRAVALLGTHLTVEAATEVLDNANHVMIALDADATARAWQIVRRWGVAFATCRVLELTKDIKNMDIEAIQDMIDHAGLDTISSMRARPRRVGTN